MPVTAAPRAATGGAGVVAELCDAAFCGDVARLRSSISDGGSDPNTGDYDRRTPLHVAASEGRLEAVRYLVDEAKADPSPVDRWGNTPLDDALRGARAQARSSVKPRRRAPRYAAPAAAASVGEAPVVAAGAGVSDYEHHHQYQQVCSFLQGKGAVRGDASFRGKSSSCVLL